METMEREESDYNFENLDLQEIQESEKSSFSSRRTSLSQDDRPLKKLKSGRPKQSFVWKYFVTMNNSHYCQVNISVSSKYPDGICNHKFDNSPTTSNMISHLRKIHNIINPTEQEMVSNLIIF